MDEPLLTEDFKEFLRLLNANRVDLDVWVRATAENAAKVMDALDRATDNRAASVGAPQRVLMPRCFFCASTMAPTSASNFFAS